jgi:hypothetical protein
LLPLSLQLYKNCPKIFLNCEYIMNHWMRMNEWENDIAKHHPVNHQQAIQQKVRKNGIENSCRQDNKAG